MRPVAADDLLGGPGGAGTEGASVRSAEQSAEDGIAVEAGGAEPVDAAVGRNQGGRAGVSQQAVVRKRGGVPGFHGASTFFRWGQPAVSSSPSSEP